MTDTYVPITKTCVKCSKKMSLVMFLSKQKDKSVEIILIGDLWFWFECFLRDKIKHIRNWLKDGIRHKWYRKHLERTVELLSRLLERIREWLQEDHNDRLLLLFDHQQIRRLHIALSEYRDYMSDNVSYCGVEQLKVANAVIEIVRIRAQNSKEDVCVFCSFGISEADIPDMKDLSKRCTVCRRDKDLEDFDSWIKYGDSTEHMEITLIPDMMDWLGDYLRQETEVSRHVVKKYQERQKNGEFCDCYSYIDSVKTSNTILELMTFSRMHKISSYELTYLPSDTLSRVQQQQLQEQQDQQNLVFRPDIDDIDELHSMLSASLVISILDNPFLGNKKLKKINYVLETVKRQVQDFGIDICRDCMDTQKIKQCCIICTAKAYQNQAHIILPKKWVGEYVLAIDTDTDPSLDPQVVDSSYEGSPGSVKISDFVGEFEDVGHLVLPKEWAEKLVFIRVKGKYH